MEAGLCSERPVGGKCVVDLGVPSRDGEGSQRCRTCGGETRIPAGECGDRSGGGPECWACWTEGLEGQRREEFQTVFRPLCKWIDSAKDVKQTCEQAATHNRIQARQSERQIKDEFEKLHQFLREEEEARIAALREEEQQKSEIIDGKLEKVKREISSLSVMVKSIEREMGKDNISFLQRYRKTITRTWVVPENPKQTPGTLINVAKYLGNLKYRVWEKMLGTVQYTPVILDPNTADPFLRLSEYLTGVRDGDEDQRLPNNPERFTSCAEMLGWRGLASGRRRWEVEVGRNTNWIMGVANGSVQRKGVTPACPENGIWSICLRDGEYGALESPSVPLSVQKKLHRVRVELDWDGGQVIFSDPTDGTHLYTFTHPFTERVYPYFCTSCTLYPLTIIPEQVFVNVDQPNY